MRAAVAWVAGGLVFVCAALMAVQHQPAVRGFDVGGFSQLPVLEGGRVKPLDSVARNSLLMIHGRQTFTPESPGGPEQSAIEWLLDVVYRPEVATRQAVFNIDDPDVLGLLGLKPGVRRYFSFADIQPALKEIQQQGDTALAIESQRRSRFQRAIVTLYERLRLFQRLANTLHVWGGASLEAELAGGARDRQALAELALFRPLAPRVGERADQWKNVGEALEESGDRPAVDPRLKALAQLEAAYVANAPWGFNDSLAVLRGAVQVDHSRLWKLSAAEVVFNQAEPFYVGMIAYLLALLLVFVSWLLPTPWLPSAAYGLVASGVVIHTSGLVARIALQGRPPVTNLYSSAIFIGWVVVLLGLVLERIYRRSFAIAVAAAVGFSTLLIAQNLMSDGDTLEMMRAVLDSNFWLATHVVAVTVGYSGTFLAGALAVGYALRRQLVAAPDPDTTRSLVGMTYGTICFAMFFSFVGTVLGGIWADQSWGRFWGWDPKENGALLIVLWNAMILHARMGGYVRERGMMAMAIFGNIVTGWSWFGVNMLGIGLHSYGFMDKAFWSLAIFSGVQVALIGLCLVRPMLFRMFGTGPAVTPPSPQSLGGGASLFESPNR